MTAEFDYRWRLREVMAASGLYATTDLRPLLADRGFPLSQSQVYRLVAERPERLNLRMLMALLDIFGCTMEDLIEPVRGAGTTTTEEGEAGRRSGAEVRFGSRPTRARVLPD
ncbi:XRE family transcriptional regulator [Nonomuraea mesophila]|uniref:XRE family transcriptional regulator n=1 Tax=Nonomuraea mesophila TaxID=2530382 RepID=A0A4R5FWL9_9ACTN|nr:helix-turn-helix transcriptional regulator [Nonomuraea mesophila]TDE58620.1 XRE family transcriptional regulator [Nonomuraea mesophila]